MESLVQVHVDGPIATLTIHRPDRLNALNRAALNDLSTAVRALAAQREIRCGILRGSGEKAFVAGADISEMEGLSKEQAAEFAELGQHVFTSIEELPFPMIAKVQGYALGGGCELALACDFIYASDKAVFGLPEVKLGIIPGFGGTQRLARRVGLAFAKELIFSGRNVDASEALRIGLANAVLPLVELEPAVLRIAGQIANAAPLAVATAKRVIPQSQQTSLQEGLAVELAGFAECFESADRREGMAAFREKRPAKFTRS